MRCETATPLSPIHNAHCNRPIERREARRQLIWALCCCRADQGLRQSASRRIDQRCADRAAFVLPPAQAVTVVFVEQLNILSCAVGKTASLALRFTASIGFSAGRQEARRRRCASQPASYRERTRYELFESRRPFSWIRRFTSLARTPSHQRT